MIIFWKNDKYFLRVSNEALMIFFDGILLPEANHSAPALMKGGSRV